MGKLDHNLTTTKHNKAQTMWYSMGYTVYRHIAIDHYKQITLEPGSWQFWRYGFLSAGGELIELQSLPGYNALTEIKAVVKG